MERKYPNLGKPIKLGNVNFKNRMFSAPVGGTAGLLCENKNGIQELVSGDTILCAVGQRARRPLVEALLDCAPYVAQIGDCVTPATITTVYN